VRGGRADATLVNLMEDSDTKVRFLAANALSSHGHDHQQDALREASLTGLGYTSFSPPKSKREALCSFANAAWLWPRRW